MEKLSSPMVRLFNQRARSIARVEFAGKQRELNLQKTKAFVESDDYRFEARVEARGYTAVGKFLNSSGGTSGGRRRSGGRGRALGALLQLQGGLFRRGRGVMGGGRRRGAVVRPGCVQQHLQRCYRV